MPLASLSTDSNPLRNGLRSLLTHLPSRLAEQLYGAIGGTGKRLKAPASALTVTLRNGTRMSLNLHDGMQRNLYYTGVWETACVKCLEPYVTEGAVFIDIGANIGFYSLWAAARSGRSGQVFSIEPNPNTLAFLKANVGLNPEIAPIQVIEAALSDTDSMLTFEFNIGSLGMGHIQRENEKSALTKQKSALTKQKKVEVQSRSLASLLTEFSRMREAGVMKMDAEGAEGLILNAVKDYLLPPIVLIEVEDRHLEHYGTTGKAVIELMVARGYQVREVLSNGCTRNLSAPYPTEYRGNFLFQRKP
ncbi:FkbM family methyltransferase [Armatimonas sp.]|uniref:FkbM family methyltransferase n=1 Tax=Armatimonas sp. TaxID=1872638 RepID=UPI003752D9D9